MARVSESSSIHAIQHAVGKTKSRLEDLQIKGSNLRRIQKPSDDPVGNTEILSIRSKKIDGKQYQRNASVAKAQLTFSENAIDELNEVLLKAKDIAIAQSSNLFDVNVRKSVAKEIEQLRNQAISIANRRLGNKYIFAGHKSLTKPFDDQGNYLGDKNETKIEVSKDFFVPISFNGQEIFFEKDGVPLRSGNPLQGTPLDNFSKKMKLEKNNIEYKEVETINGFEEKNQTLAVNKPQDNNRSPATIDQNQANPATPTGPQLTIARSSIFSDLQRLHNAMITDNHEVVQDMLPKLDKNIDRLIETRTKIGSLLNSIDNAVDAVQKQELINEEYKTNIEDADVAELFTDLTRQQNTLKATYKASAQLMNRNLMDYIN